MTWEQALVFRAVVLGFQLGVLVSLFVWTLTWPNGEPD